MKKIMKLFKNHTVKERLQSLKKEQVVEMVNNNKVTFWLVCFSLFVMIAFGILICGMGRQEKEQETLFLEEQAQLIDMTAYLDEIETVVSANKERLSESKVFQSDTEQTLATVQNELSVLEQDLIQIEKILQSHSQTENIINNEVSEELTQLSCSQQEIKEQIAMVNAAITELLTTVRKENEESFSNTFEKLKTIQTSLEQTQKDVKGYYEDLTEFLTLLQEENTEHFTLTFEKLEQLKEQLAASKEEGDRQNEALKEFLTLLQEEDNGNAAITFEKLEVLKETLETEQEKDKEYFDSITEFLSLIKEENSRQKEEMANELLSVQAQINEILQYEFDLLQLKLEEDYLSLMQEMENMQKQVESTHVSITELLNLMEGADESRQEEIKTAFAEVNTSIEQIRMEYQSAHANLENLIQTVQETQMVNHEETLSVLSEVEVNLEEVSMESLEQISNSLQVIEDNFSDSLTNMQNSIHKNFSDLNTEISNNFFQTNSDISNKLELMNNNISTQHQELSNNISNQYNQISNTINNSSGEQQESLNNLMNYLEQKFGQVFTFVSNGKKKVVSALLTKGVSLNEDATFTQIHDAILSIEQELLIGVEQIPGDITYDYHYHVDGNGKELHAEICEISQKGGCFSTPVYHAHKTADGVIGNGNVYSETVPGGCFTVASGHTHDVVTACSKTPVYNHACDSGCGSYQYEYCDRCDYCIMASCGGCKLGTAYYHSNNKVLAGYNYTCGSPTNTYTAGCGKTTSTIVAYQPGCGFSDGQIIGATIIYDQSAVSTMSLEPIQEETVTESMTASEETILVSEKVTVSGNEIPPENTMDHQEEMKQTEDSVLEEMIEKESEASVETEKEETEEEGNDEQAGV